jgi:hypothetical protein
MADLTIESVAKLGISQNKLNRIAKIPNTPNALPALFDEENPQ